MFGPTTGAASYNGATVTLRHALSKGFAFDFNYTLGHSIDRGGGAESGYGSYGGIMLDPYHYTAFRGSSDFDARHNINANFVLELPFGKGKMFMRNASTWLDEIVGGWQISTIARFRTGLPSAIFYNGVLPTNFSFGAMAYPINGSYQYGPNGFNVKTETRVSSRTQRPHPPIGCPCMPDRWDPAPRFVWPALQLRYLGRQILQAAHGGPSPPASRGSFQRFQSMRISTIRFWTRPAPPRSANIHSSRGPDA